MRLLKGSNNVHVETGYPGANVGCMTTERGVVMIESPIRPTDAISWRSQVQDKGEIIYLIHTEGHHDHVMGDYFFHVPVICHEKSRETIIAVDTVGVKQMIADTDPEGAVLANNYSVNVPSITFSERLTLHAGRHTFQLMNTPGHTAGQTSVLIPEERVVFVGDNINYKSPAFLHEADPDAWLQSLEKIGRMNVDHIVPGHGETCEPSYIVEWTEFLEEWFEDVRQDVAKGWSKEESIERTAPPSRYPIPRGDEFAKMMVRMNVSHLYDVFGKVKESRI